ncbi:hypothetical protein B7494_g3758 [Chlorociboria aeruginascens]|nr:hypothetical protein B7494_g3758 [Chlorociboria aeruginascens]
MAMSTITAIGGWIVVAGVVYYYFIHNGKGDRSRRPQPLKQLAKSADTRKEPKAKKVRKEGGQSSGDADSRSNEKPAKRKKAQQVVLQEEAKATSRPPKSNDPDHEVDDREFARQLSSAKAGTKLASKITNGPRQKSIKQSRAQEKLPAAEVGSGTDNAASSATGGDADDDQSSMNSPDFGATIASSLGINGDVSDMLEPAASGPPVLRLTEPTNSAPPKKNSKPFEQALTKKQRQNRRKAEEQKLQRQEADKERQALEEKQRRTARLAEGRPAKDGSGFMKSQAPPTSWTTPAGINRDKDAETKKVELLDTYEPATNNANAEHLYSDNEKIGSKYRLPGKSDDEQLEIAVEDSKKWEVVKKSHKKTNAVAGKLPDSDAGHEDCAPPPTSSTRGPERKLGIITTQSSGKNEALDRDTVATDSEWEVS